MHEGKHIACSILSSLPYCALLITAQSLGPLSQHLSNVEMLGLGLEMVLGMMCTFAPFDTFKLLYTCSYIVCLCSFDYWILSPCQWRKTQRTLYTLRRRGKHRIGMLLPLVSAEFAIL